MKRILFSLLLIVSTLSVYSQQEVEVINQTKKNELDSNIVKWKAALIKDSILQAQKSKVINIYWADKVVAFSSQYSKTDRAAYQALGAPNVLPTGGDAYTNWCTKEKDGKEIDQNAFIRVGYKNPARIQQVAIAEGSNPGAITKVTLFGANGEKQVVYEQPAKNLGLKCRMLNIILPQPTEFYVSEVEVRLDPIAVIGRNGIDAIGISDSKDTIKWSINLVPNLEFTSKPENLGEAINSIYDEVAPMISPDGRTIFFVRKFHPENAGGINDEDDIWYSVRDENGHWTPAKNIGLPLNNKYNNYVQSITPDGNQLLLANIYNKDGSTAPGASLTYKTRQGWAFPEKQNIDDFINLSPFANYYLSNDGQFLIMALERKDSYGELDLYVSFRKGDNRWSKPLNLGPIINTSVNDYSPFLAADGVTLYYSTSGKSGYGKEDIFVTTRLDDTWQNWTEPQNLGPILNSSESDTKYNIPASGEYAYFSSTNKSMGKNDIFRIKLPSKVKPKPVVLISGKVLNEKTNKPIDARIIVEELPGGKEVAVARTDPNTGEFKIILPAGKKYGFRAIGLGFFDVNKNIDLTDITEYTEIEDEMLRLSPIEVGSVVRLNNIFFEFAKAVLLPESYPELDRTAEFLKNNPTIEIEIGGHTDDIGSDVTNQKLSEKRARAVADYLISKGVDAKRMTVVGYGESRPIAFNTDEEGRAMNRRVEFKVMKK
ncbi:MAG: OmpA family protein [Bacteroidales bacterium]|nr:OmpA family protein [Bacteroidales bacterium]